MVNDSFIDGINTVLNMIMKRKPSFVELYNICIDIQKRETKNVNRQNILRTICTLRYNFLLLEKGITDLFV